jgi:hypothetical protein
MANRSGDQGQNRIDLVGRGTNLSEDDLLAFAVLDEEVHIGFNEGPGCSTSSGAVAEKGQDVDIKEVDGTRLL